ncbi:hypothetical protein [Kamptonema formosum]|uniref:hypothetical protein n=1 Tax=Kamptonema formosum TaxID=331992 RepID=UPI000347DA34|nr:hypothetical protein [Oscillatoria sp. PCC 10802]
MAEEWNLPAADSARRLNPCSRLKVSLFLALATLGTHIRLWGHKECLPYGYKA